MTNDELGKLSLSALVRHVMESDGLPEPLSYQELARMIGHIGSDGHPFSRGMGKVLERMGKMLQRVSDDWGREVPHLQALIISKNGGLPSDGLKEFWPHYLGLTNIEKNNHVLKTHEKIRDFGSRWNQVLERLEIEPISLPTRERQVPPPRRGHGGDSPAHLALKEYISQHPELVGIAGPSEAHQEYVLPSLDTLDVLFKTEGEWVGVEVKSSTSDRMPVDYQRGLYQCVKYQAILTAMQWESHYKIPATVRVEFVLQTRLPDDYRALAQRLGVTPIENVEVVE